ncbi:hypothetical protein N898_17290 [Salmonella enterica subsp. arizonae serovar 62:z36:- str. RKS2983]|nr:hypothetical protein N898_17290 [Salmonella enterica subsp. arizonae serovar 62:z36:- str. RKS2983]
MLTEVSDWGKQGSQRICKSKYDEFWTSGCLHIHNVKVLYIPQAQFVHGEVKDFHDRD